jgi:hypothetical protein
LVESRYGPNAVEVWKERAKEKRKAEERAVLAIFDQCDGLSLEEVWFQGFTKVTLTREPENVDDILESTPEEAVSRATTRSKVKFQTAPNDCDHPVWL